MINNHGSEELKEYFSNYYGTNFAAMDLREALFYQDHRVLSSNITADEYAEIYRLSEEAGKEILNTYLNASMVLENYVFKPNLIQKIVMKIFKIG